MNHRIIFILMWTSILTFFGCGEKNTSNNHDNKSEKNIMTEQYVSMDCETGDITLTLNSNYTFDLTILFWNDKTNEHTGQETIKGNWTKTNRLLTLNADDRNKIIYELTTTNMKIGNHEINNKTYSFKSSDKDFFASKFDLTQKEQVDKFLINATK